jgi:c-di-GMP-binding flagellar brake protein YcgR
MSKTDNATTVSQSEILSRACERNTPLELHYFNPSQATNSVESEVLRAQTRLISLDPDSITVDFPQDIGHTLRLRSGIQVRAYFTLDETIYNFHATVAEMKSRVNLNRDTAIVGCRLTRPDRIVAAQRREDHRVSVASQEPIPTRIHEAGIEDFTACPINARRGSGRIVNLSRGGMAVRVEGDDRHKFPAGRRCFFTFTIPSDKTPMLMLGEIRHLREILDGSAAVLGIQFLTWPSTAEHRLRVAAIGRFVVDIERALLRQRKCA